MKTKILSLSILSLLSITSLFAQDRTTVTANSSEISDNLDLRAVASIFGDSENLEDFERRLNDPKMQISNLDLNEDNKVDYLRVIETVEGYTHIIVIQSVLGRDLYQDVATVEVQKDSNNRIQVQVVGDVYMYGANYIYEPVYVSTPVIYASFWVGNYRPYYSTWYWGYYPTYYYTWTPYPVFRYRSHIGICINNYHHYNYVSYRRCGVAYNSYYRGQRGNAYEVRYPNRSFGIRHTTYANRYELDKTRNIRTVGTSRELAANSPRNSTNGMSTRGNATRSESPRAAEPRGNNRSFESPRAVEPKGNNRSFESPRAAEPKGNNRSFESPRTAEPKGNNRSFESPRTAEPKDNNRSFESPRAAEPRSNSRSFESPRAAEPKGNNRSFEAPRNSNQGGMTQPRGNSQRSEGSSRGGGNRRA